jgi:hypothetical protein
MAPDALRAFSVRLPAGLLGEVHRWAEEKGLDLTTAIRELTTLGLETATRPGAPSPADRKEMKTWEKDVERALRAGNSPFEPFLDRNHPDAKPLPAILAKMDYPTIYERVKEKRQRAEPPVERRWKRMKEEAQPLVKPLMEALDRLEQRFLARKQIYYAEGYEGEYSSIRWLLSDALLKMLNEASADPDVEAITQLIAARYLVALNPQTPWQFEWDE